MSPQTPDYSKTLLFEAAVQAASFRRMVTMLMILFIALAVFMLVGHSVAPGYVGKAEPALLRAAGLFAGIWFVFNALWALINHLVSSLSRVAIESLAVAVSGYTRSMRAALEPETTQTAATPEEVNVAYMQDFLKDRLKPTTDEKA